MLFEDTFELTVLKCNDLLYFENFILTIVSTLYMINDELQVKIQLCTLSNENNSIICVIFY